jgi:hypothetical protein
MKIILAILSIMAMELVAVASPVAGDIVLLQVIDTGTATGCLVKWSPLVDLPAGTVINFTDRSWINGPSFFSASTGTEGTIVFTAPSTITAGTIFTMAINAPASVTVTRDSDSASFNSDISVSGWTATFVLTAAGDNFFIYTGADASPTFIFGMNFTTVTLNRDPVSGWSTNTSATTTSLLPSGLTSGGNALSLDYSSSGARYMAYTGSISATTRDAWLLRIANASNWTGSSSTVAGSFGNALAISVPNTAPVFVGSTTTLNINQDVSATDVRSFLHANDPDIGQTLTWTTALAPAHGVLTISSATAASGGSDITPGGVITYTPTAGYTGSDSFSVQVSDGIATASRTISVNVADTTPPTVTIGSPSSTLTKSGPINFTVTWADANLNSSSISLTALQVSQNLVKTGTVVVNSISVTGTGNTRTVQLNSLAGDGTVVIDIPANTATDLAGNEAPAAGPSATFTVDNTAPTVIITSQPAAHSTINSASFSFTDSDSGSGVASANYQLDGGALTAATSPVNFSGLAIGPHTFVLQVTDLAGNVGTASYNWSVGTAPAITVPPAGATVTYGSNVSFSVTASGTPTLAYQWYFDGTALNAATATNYSLPSVTTNNAGDYSVVITNLYGSVTSSVATLVFSPATSAVNLTSSENPAGYQDALTFTATLPTDATGNVVFSSANGPISTNALSGGVAASIALNNLPRGTNLITAAYSGDFNYSSSTDSLNQIVTNHPPVAADITNTYVSGTAYLINLAHLLTSNVTDADGDTILLTGLGVSTNGIVPATNATYILFLNTNNLNDQFTYTVSDGYGGSATGTIYMLVSVAPTIFGQTAPAIIASNGAALVTFYGIPGKSYTVWRSTTDVSGPYQAVWTTNAPAQGRFIFTDDPAPVPNAFYKLSHP